MWADCPLGLVQFCFVAFAMTTSRERLCKENKGNTTFFVEFSKLLQIRTATLQCYRVNQSVNLDFFNTETVNIDMFNTERIWVN